MADLEACRAALTGLSERLVEGGSALPERTVSCTISDLGATFHARLTATGLGEITAHETAADDRPPAQIRMTLSSDDLLALVAGELAAGSAFMNGRLRVQASFPDLMMLRSLG